RLRHRQQGLRPRLRRPDPHLPVGTDEAGPQSLAARVRERAGGRGLMGRPVGLTAAALSGLVILALAPAAGAHVTVWPSQSELGAREAYVIRVPNEKKAATVR